MMDFRKIEAFCRVYEQRSFSKAGEVLLISQPTVSAHIQALESELGVRLLDRMGRTVLPTPAGEILYKYGLEAFKSLDAAKNEINSIMDEVAGDVVLGSGSMPSEYLLPDIVTGFAQRYPKSSLNLVVKDSGAVLKALIDCEIMLGVVGQHIKHPDLEFTKLLDDELIIVAAPSLDLSAYSTRPNRRSSARNRTKNKKYSMEEALFWPWIVRAAGSSTKKAFDATLANFGYKPRDLRVELIVDSGRSTILYVRSGLGVTAMPRLAAAEMLEHGVLVELDVKGFECQCSVYAATNVKRMPSPAASVFLSYLLEQTAYIRVAR